jgi:ATP-dependent DNA helicase RecG
LIDSGSLRKILELERQRGYANTSVFGGLDKFLENWTVQVEKILTDPKIMLRFHRRFATSYASLTKEQRLEWINKVLTFLDELEGKDGTKKPHAGSSPLAPGKLKPKVKKVVVPPEGPNLDSPVTVVRGISTALSGKFEKLGVKTVRDLLYFFPHRHLDYSRLKSIS